MVTPMNRMIVDCPKTGQPTRTSASYATMARAPDTLVVLHCAQCGESHRFSYAEACIELSPGKPLVSA